MTLRFHPILAFTTLVLASAGTLHAQLPAASPSRVGFDVSRLEVTRATVKRFVDEAKHAGIITLLARDGKIADVQAFGYRDLEQKLPMQRDTICRVYSMSKIITSVGVLILLEEGRISLDDPITNYLPELKGLQVSAGGTSESPKLVAPKRPITIKHLLTHTSGLVYDFDANDPLQGSYKRADLWSGPSLNEFIGKVGKLALKHHPGDQYSYGINTDVLGALIERVSGLSFGTFLEKRIFTPLGMKDTGFDVPIEKRGRLAKTYQNKPGGGFEEAEPILSTLPEPGRGIESGGAGIFSTVDDYARFAQMLCNGGTLEGHRILGRKTVELMTANHLTLLPDSAQISTREKGFGLGVEVSLDPGRGAVPTSPGQFGWYGAATTYCQIDPHEKLVAIAFAQHLPFNQHGFFAKWATAYYQALK
jgi:CubicO group peptidase (beta-lactamase class C family)